MASKSQIRHLSDNFLNDFAERTPTPFYWVDRGDSVPARDQIGPEAVRAFNSLESDLTGVKGPSFPLTIALTGSQGQRMEIVMLLNPETMNHGKTNATYSSYTRKGYVNQLWGPNQDILTAQGRSAAFMVPGIGLSTFLRTRSFAFVNLMALVSAYKHNGYQILDPTQTNALFTRVISRVTGVEIHYDNQIFMGHFSNFTLDEDDTHPYLFNYNFEFIISTLDGSGTEVRGHYISIPGREQAPRPIKLTEGVAEKEKEASPSPESASIEPSKPKSGELTYLVWQNATGLPWSQAELRGYTNGTKKDNLQLKARVLQLRQQGLRGQAVLAQLPVKYPPQGNQ